LIFDRQPRIQLSPPQIILLSFLSAILLGTVLLSLSISHAPGETVTILDALFTATSTVCVTGLIVVDTGTAYSRFGQVVIMLLFQLGGLGILTAGALLTFATRRRVGLTQRLQLQAQLNTLHIGGIIKLIRRLFIVVLVSELLGTLLLYLRFARTEGTGEGLFYALFHSISAFNNAGFSLYSDSLERYVSDPLVNLTTISLIVVGGLGFIVILETLGQLYYRSQGRSGTRRPLSLQSKLVLCATLVLTLFTSLMVLILEWNNPDTLAPLSLSGKLLASLFQGVTPRTAGFNTLNYAEMTPATLIITTLMMFIGANPGSTGGGIKTVTFVLLFGNAWAVMRGRSELSLFGRRIGTATLSRASVIALSALLVIFISVTLLAISDADLGIVPLLFEVVSAFATVGLSLGITDELSTFGRWVIIVLMYLGRVGFLTFALALTETQTRSQVRYPTEEVVVG
jgi:trk system potassium uptake protein TrkH